MYKVDPNNSTKQVPANSIYDNGNILSESVAYKNYSYATTPAARTVVERADHVIIQPKDGAATYIFGYHCTASIGGFDAVCGTSGSAQTGSMVIANNDNPIKLEINPHWWDTGNDEAAGGTGEVTFVYSKQDK